jgi:hypothetical protein
MKRAYSCARPCLKEFGMKLTLLKDEEEVHRFTRPTLADLAIVMLGH